MLSRSLTPTMYTHSKLIIHCCYKATPPICRHTKPALVCVCVCGGRRDGHPVNWSWSCSPLVQPTRSALITSLLYCARLQCCVWPSSTTCSKMAVKVSQHAAVLMAQCGIWVNGCVIYWFVWLYERLMDGYCRRLYRCWWLVDESVQWEGYLGKGDY